MCFSAQADIVAGVVVGTIGLDALRHVRARAEVALAAIPVVLASHLLVEAVVWWGLEDRVGQAAWRPALGLYLLIAFGVLPVLVPFAVGALEPAANRRRLQRFTALGAAVAAALMYAVVRGPVTATVQGHHIDYRSLARRRSGHPLRHRHVRIAVGVDARTRAVVRGGEPRRCSFISLWCAWATVTSVAIAVHLRYAHPSRRRITAYHS
jgi:hypothetical protein